MRSAARQSARLTSCQRLRSVSRARSPCIAQRRNLQVSAGRSQEAKPPGTPSEDFAAPNAEQRSRQNEHQYHPEEREQQASALGGNGNGNGDGRRLGFRRTLRQRKYIDIPKPPELPEWFLKHNVALVAEKPALGSKSRQLKCVDRETGHTLFHVPCYPDEATEQADEKRRGERSAEAKDEQAKQATIPGITMLDQNFFQQRFSGDVPAVLVGDQESPLGFKMPPGGQAEDSLRYDPLTWTFLETEASIRAAMELAGDSAASSSHAASRSDIHLMCPDDNAHEHMDQYVRDLAQVLNADTIRLDANDFEDLTNDYVGGSSDTPGSFSTLAYEIFDGAAANGREIRGGPSRTPFESEEQEEQDEDEEDEDANPSEVDLGHFGSFDDLRKALFDKRHDLHKQLGSLGVAGVSIGMPPPNRGFGGFSRGSESPGQLSKRMSGSSEYIQWDDARLSAVLSSLLDAPTTKRSAGEEGASPAASHEASIASFAEETMAWPNRAAGVVVDILDKMGRGKDDTDLPTKFESADVSTTTDIESGKKRTIVHLRDLRPMVESRLGDAILKCLVRVVQKRRKAGEEIVVVGTSAMGSSGSLDSLLETSEDSPFRLTVVPPLFDMSAAERSGFDAASPELPRRILNEPPSYGRITEINFRHIRSMLSRLGEGHMDIGVLKTTLEQLRVPGTHILSEKVLAQDQIQRLVLTAIGLARSHAKADSVLPAHLALATAILARADHATHNWEAYRSTRSMAGFRRASFPGKSAPSSEQAEQSKGQARLEALKKNSNQHETRLMSGVVDPANIKTRFEDVHAPPETIEALKSLTTLALQRPDAFKYGVLASDRITGLLLYGPPGTGKTLLAKAVAKESSATVLEVSGAQIYEKYVGEGEKMVRAVFSLAKKLSPCVVFIDEADAIFGSRSGGAGNRNTHREIINQFLREWDGMDDNRVFMMVASNRPFDLDDAVLRRLPRRLLVDLPVAKDRESILGIHTRAETLAPEVSLSKLAEQTPLYSGSDLKNVVVAAALAAVREENEALAANKSKADGDEKYELPERRTLTEKHFEVAMKEISASISEDMSSLTAIKKFDEQYGDRRGRKKRSGLGFGLGDEGKVDEAGARVRGGP